VLLPIKVEDSELIEQVLSERRGRPVRLMVPARGEKKQLVQRAVANALESLRQARARWLADTGKKREALEQLQDALSLPELPARIECYDISNIQGTSAVGSMVVFVDGVPRSKEYRKFRIKHVSGQNDFAMMQEVLKRRFWKVRRETEGEGANEGTPERPEHEDTDRAVVNEALRGPNAGAVMTEPNGAARRTRGDGATSRSGFDSSASAGEFDASTGSARTDVISRRACRT
jgi:hypothetical protein